MIRFAYLPLALLVLLTSCKIKSKTAGEAEEKSTATLQALIGSYAGSFGDNKITVLITKITGDTVEGRSVVGGNDRPFIGLVKNENDVLSITAKEPGDDKHDGKFSFSFKTASPDVITGDWAAYDTALGAKTFSLNRKAFAYLKDVGIYPQASTRELKDDDVNNLSKWELEVMRNEIFARHGYCFKKKAVREVFEELDWYIPNTTNVAKDLTELEKKNITLIKKYEKYSDEYGDEFGR